VIQAILRHSNVNVTLGYYIKPQTHDVIAAMGKFEAEMAAHNFGDSNGTVNPILGATPKSAETSIAEHGQWVQNDPID
jgi:hypothetical protein